METPTPPLPDIQQKIIEWLEAAGNATAEFVTTQIPPLIQEYLYWKFMENFVSALFNMIPVLASLIWLIFYAKKMIQKCLCYDRKGNWNSCFTGIPVLVSVLSIPVFFTCFPLQEIKDMIYIKIAPKVYLIDKCSQFIKK